MERMRKMKKKILQGLRGREKEEALQQPQEEEEKGEPPPPPPPAHPHPHHPHPRHLPPPSSAGPGGVPGYPSLRRGDLWKEHRAAADGDLSLLRRLLRKEPRRRRDTQDPGGRTPLHLACANGHVDVVAFLIDSKCQLDLCDSDMRTPLMKTVQCRQEPCAIHLLKYGADPNVADARGDTALHLAASTASCSLGLHLLDHGARLEALNQDGSTPLMAAVVENDCDMVELLLSKGASVHATDKAGRTPLLLAVSNRKRDVTNLLLAYGSNISHRDDSGWSVRDYATLSDDPILLQYIADYSKWEKEGEAPADTMRILSMSDRPGRAGDPGVTLGAPATNIEVIDDPSAGDSVRDSVKTDDTWRSSEEEDLEPSPKKPSLARLLSISQRPKQNHEESRVPTDPVVGAQPNRSVCDAGDANDFLPKSLFHARSFPQPVRSSPGSFSRQSQMAAYFVSKQEGSFEEEKEEDEEEDGESPGVAAQHLHGPAISLNQISSREESAKKGLLKLGAEEEEEDEEKEEKDLESPWDSESLPESPGNPTLPSLPASPAKIKTQMETLTEEPGGSANAKPELDNMDLEPAAASSALLKQGEGREKPQSDLMEELGLDNTDDIEDASDWDSTSLSQGLPCPSAYNALTWGDPSHPAHLPLGPARVEEATVTEMSVALKGPLRPDINTEEIAEGEAKGKSVIATPGSLEKQSPEKRTDEAERIDPDDGKQVGGEVCRGEAGEKISTLDPALWEDRYEKLWVAQEKKEVKSNFKNITAELKARFGEIGVGETPKESAADTFGGALEGGNEPPPPRPCVTAIGIQGKAESGEWKSLLAANSALEPSRELPHEGENRSLGQNQDRSYDLSPDRAACREGNKMRPFRLTEEDGNPIFRRKRPDCPPMRGQATAASEALLWTFLQGPVAAGGRETWPCFKGSVPAARRLGPETGGRGGPSEGAPKGDWDVALERDVARFKSEVGLLQAAFQALEKEKEALQKEVQELARKKESENPETTSAANIQEETEQKSRADKNRRCGMKEASRGAMSEENHGTDTASSSDKVGFAPVPCKGINPTAGLKDRRKRGNPRPISKQRASPPALGDRHQRLDSSSWSDTSLEERRPGKTWNRRNKAGERRDLDEELARENATLREEVATLRAELSRLRLRREEDERRHLEDNGALKEKTIELRKELKRSEEALAQAVSQRDGQVAALKTEAALLATQVDHLKGDKEKLESKADALRARLGAAARELEESRDSREGLERALQRERDEAQRLKDRLEDEARALREANGGLSQRLGQAESRANALEGELQRATHALRDKTLLLENTQRDLEEARGRAEELDGALRREKEQASQWAAKGEAVQERLAQLQSDNLLLRQQMEDLQSQGLLKERAAAGVQETFRDLFTHLRAEAEKQVQQVEERNKELAAWCADLREQVGRHEAEKANQEGALRQLQQELADTLKKQSMSEASLEVSVRCRNKLEEDKQQLQEEIERIQSRLENEQREVKKLEELKRSAESRVEQEMKRNGELQKEYNGMRNLMKAAKKKLKEYENGETSPQAGFHGGLKNQCSEIDVELGQLRKKLENEQRKVKQLKELKRSAELRLEQEMKRNGELQKENNGMRKLVKAAKKKLKEYENGETSPQAGFHRGLKNQCSEIDVELEQLRKKADDLSLQLEAESARRAQLESANAELQVELSSARRLHKSYDDLQKSKLQLEEEIAGLRHQVQRHAFDLDQAERSKRDAEDRAKQEVKQKLEEVNLFLQTQAASQEALEQIKAANHAALRHQMESRIRDLESELGKLQRRQQEVDLLKESAHSKLERANEMLAESNARLLQERSRSGSLLAGSFWGGSLSADPAPETLSFGHLGGGGLAFSRPLGLAGGLVSPAGRPQVSKRRVEAYVAKMQKKMEQAIKMELDKAREEMDAASARIPTIGSVGGSSTLLNPNPDPVSKAYQEYLEVLRKNHGI